MAECVPLQKGWNMKPAQWVYWSNPHAMLEVIRRQASPRKLRLFGCACCHRAWSLLPAGARRVVQLAELVADGLAGADELQAAVRAVEDARILPVLDAEDDETADGDLTDPYELSRRPQAGRLSVATTLAVTAGRSSVCDALNLFASAAGAKDTEERRAQCHLIRDVFGNPFKPARFDHAWLRWNNAFLPNIARVIYDDYTFGDLPILADALEEAGCDNKDVLQHCRSRKEHVRGCWVIDGLLGLY
jgi:hypothetical protein